MFVINLDIMYIKHPVSVYNTAFPSTQSLQSSFFCQSKPGKPFKMKMLKHNRKLDEKNLFKLIFFLECFIETRYPKLSFNSLFSQQNGLNMLILNMELSCCEAPISSLYNIITLCYIECNSCQMP